MTYGYTAVFLVKASKRSSTRGTELCFFIWKETLFYVVSYSFVGKHTSLLNSLGFKLLNTYNWTHSALYKIL